MRHNLTHRCPYRLFITMAMGVFISGCAAGSFELTRPATTTTTTNPDGSVSVTKQDGATVKANAVALFRDTGLEGFNYSVDEKSKGDGLLPATESRSATVGAKGYTGTTKAETLIKLLEALP